MTAAVVLAGEQSGRVLHSSDPGMAFNSDTTPLKETQRGLEKEQGGERKGLETTSERGDLYFGEDLDFDASGAPAPGEAASRLTGVGTHWWRGPRRLCG